MTAEQFIAEKAVLAVKSLYGADLPLSMMQVGVTRKDFEGDYTLVVFPLLKTSHKSPVDTGNAIGGWLVENCPEISAFNAVQGFLNLSLSNVYWRETLDAVHSDGTFGQLPSTGRRIMVEFSSPNTNKPLHLGHVRNNLLGASISNLLKAAGNEVIKTTLVNDRGVHICKSMYAWQERFDGATPESTGKKGDHLVGKYYVLFSNELKKETKAIAAERGISEDEAERLSPILKEAQAMLVKWESGDKEIRELWAKMNGWVYEGFDKTYERMGISFHRTYYESNTYLSGKSLVNAGLERGIFERQEDGSVWCNLEPDGLDRKLLLRGDGTSVYMTQDLGTAEQRYNEYKFDELIYVVGDEQNYHFKVLKLILKKLGFDWSDAIYHLSYGMVELPEGKMKSREGTVVDADDLIEKMYQTAKETSLELGKLGGIPEQEQERLFEMIGLGALKYFILKVDPKKTMLFDPKESIDFNGNTGPFIQYTHARIKSILRKAKESGVIAGEESLSVPENFSELLPKEVEIIKLLNSYPVRIKEAGDAHSPALVANFIYDLAKEFNQYYQSVSILKESDSQRLLFRLAMLKEIAFVLRKGMLILGIELPERM